MAFNYIFAISVHIHIKEWNVFSWWENQSCFIKDNK